MHTFISLLRGINVGGHKKIKMAALKDMCEGLGFQNVVTYIQSGNIVFDCAGTEERELEATIKAGIQDTFGFEVQVMVMNPSYLDQVIARNPFLSQEAADHKKLLVTFLGSPVDPVDAKGKLSLDSGRDEIFIHPKHVYLYCPDGYRNTKYSHPLLERKLKVAATTRNWRTTLKMQELARR